LHEIHEVGEAVLEALVGFLGPRIEYPGVPDARNGKPNGKPNARSNGKLSGKPTNRKEAGPDDARRASGGVI
jgi:hypothetical protein